VIWDVGKVTGFSAGTVVATMVVRTGTGVVTTVVKTIAGGDVEIVTWVTGAVVSVPAVTAVEGRGDAPASGIPADEPGLIPERLPAGPEDAAAGEVLARREIAARQTTAITAITAITRSQCETPCGSWVAGGCSAGTTPGGNGAPQTPQNF
jgi:hypothetical protein